MKIIKKFINNDKNDKNDKKEELSKMLKYKIMLCISRIYLGECISASEVSNEIDEILNDYTIL